MTEYLEQLTAFQRLHPAAAALFWTWTGACIGSFLNVCIWRVPNEMSLISPPSHCPKCGHRIPFYENIPVLSWFLLKGKCSSCREPISPRYPIVEGLTALTFSALLLFAPLGHLTGGRTALAVPALILWFATASVLIAAAFTDCDWRIIPDGFVLTLLGAEVLYAALSAFLTDGNWTGRLAAAMGFGVQIVLMGLILTGIALFGKALFGKTALGWGDVKLLTAMTPVLTFYGMIWVILTASVLLAACAPVYRKLKPKMRHRAMPFAPFIALGAAIVFPVLPELLKLTGLSLPR